ncbi:MAG: TraR/DksA family transcriptional regulator [Bacteroidales bacterium]
MISKEERDFLREKIVEDIKLLKKRIEETEGFSDPVAPDNAIGRISRMDAINNKSIFDASLRNSINRLKLLEAAMNCIDDSEYGICRKCHQPVSVDRLKVRPEILFCASCM